MGPLTAVRPWRDGSTFTLLDVSKILLLMGSVAISAPWYLRRMGTIEDPIAVLVFLVLMALCLVAILTASFCKYHSARVVFGLLMAASTVLVESYRAIFDDFFSYDAYVTLIQAAAFADDAGSQFTPQIAKAAFVGGLVLVGIVLPSRSEFAQRKSVALACLVVPVAVVVALSTLLYVRGGAGVKGLPSSIVALPYATVRTYEYVEFDRGKREQVSIPLRADPNRVDVILIIDESIRGDYLDINAADGVASGLDRNDGSVHNFGFAASATNCSGGSNVILRFGGTREGYHRAIHTQPSIWSHAHAAGLRTVYLDAQRTKGNLQNFMYDEERQEIDVFQQFGDTEVVNRDMKIAEVISQLTRNDIPEMIVANKVGAHFPVNDKYPDAFLRFRPVARRGDFVDLTDTGDKSGFDGDWERYRNSYRNTITWNVGEFFRVIFDNANLEQAFMIYTSDHAQDFHEDGSPGLAFHCSRSPSPNEGLVPLVLVTRHSEWADVAARWSRRNRSSASHFNIFPTLLRVMGYEGDFVHEAYGPSLFESTQDPLTFLSGFDRFGRAPRWTTIQLPADSKVSGPE